MKILHCIGISPGIAAGPIYFYDSEKIIVAECNNADPVIEISRLEHAISQAHSQIQNAFQMTLTSISRDKAEIFEAHLMVLEDPELIDRVHELIHSNQFTAEYAWYKAVSEYEEMISTLQVDEISERAMDIHDVGQRVLRILLGKTPQTHLNQPSIIVTEELMPSDTIGFDKSMVLAFCTARGGPTSHVAILSRAMGIPAVAGIDPRLFQFHNDLETIVDGNTGTVILDPNESTRKKYIKRSSEFTRDFEIAFSKARFPAISRDNQPFKVAANIGSPHEVVDALEYGAEGVGLLRTEFLFLGRETPPSEEEQYLVYRDILEQFGQKPVIFRTLDIGGDKPAHYLKIAKENNPFLGLRGTRLALKREEVLQTQLRALFRAGIGSNFKIMFPMIGTIGELRAAKEQISRCMSLLDQKGLEYNSRCEIGLMIEIPSAAIMADTLIREVDFFSIGTNDLTQYTLAADRTNSQVADYANALDPSVLRLINMTVKAAHQSGKWVGLCGELAGDLAAVPVLMGMHLDEFSMSARLIPFIKEKIRKFSLTEAENISSHVLSLSSVEKVHQFLNDEGYR
ncbi:MAG: phosphoenolpyruvate--protein phosphotransferase [Chloroflexi bacterium]|nr:phosphoenolpyruvate--protein phosphotransferase [Chloroflexota bacterium]